MRLKFARSQMQIPQVDEFLLIRGLFLLFRICLDRAGRVIASVWEALLRFCVEILNNQFG